MKNTKVGSPFLTAKRLIPIIDFMPVPEQVAIAPEQLELSDLSSLPRNVTLLTKLGGLNVTITKATTLSIKVGRRIQSDEPLAQKFGARTVARTMSDATGYYPKDEQEAKQLPNVRSASWTLPDEVSWWFEVPTSSTGAQVTALVRTGDEFFLKVTEQLLTPTETPKPTADNTQE